LLDLAERLLCLTQFLSIELFWPFWTTIPSPMMAGSDAERTGRRSNISILQDSNLSRQSLANQLRRVGGGRQLPAEHPLSDTAGLASARSLYSAPPQPSSRKSRPYKRQHTLSSYAPLSSHHHATAHTGSAASSRSGHAPVLSTAGGFALITSAPFDNWWHSAYSLDVKIVSPPHTLLADTPL
jgi:hypothetical protein